MKELEYSLKQVAPMLAHWAREAAKVCQIGDREPFGRVADILSRRDLTDADVEDAMKAARLGSSGLVDYHLPLWRVVGCGEYTQTRLNHIYRSCQTVLIFQGNIQTKLPRPDGVPGYMAMAGYFHA
jgi:hypothetical protein